MKFMHGIMWGSVITAGAMLCASENIDINKKKILKKGKQLAKRIGIYL